MIYGQATLILHAGDGFLIPPGTPHNALDVGPETGIMLSTYFVDTDQPLTTLVDAPLLGCDADQMPEGPVQRTPISSPS
jgi:hypothetical protein